MHTLLTPDFFFAPFGAGPLEVGLGAALLLFFTLLMALWSLSWKALGLWHAAKNDQVAWFIVMLLINTAGILEIIYLFFFRENRSDTLIFPPLNAFKEKRKTKKGIKKTGKKAQKETEDSEEEEA